jgi:hypothetical protein
MYTEEIEIITAAINNCNQIEVLYRVIGKNNETEVMRRQEGRVWQPTETELMLADTLSGNHPTVQTLVNAFWTAEVIAAYQAAQAAAEAARNA